MNWEAAGAIGEIIGAIAVVATLAYLAIQIRQQNNTTRFTTTQNLMRQFDEINRLSATDPDFRSTLLYSGTLSDNESDKLFSIAIMYCNIWVSVQTAFEQGQIDEELFNSLTKDPSIQLERYPILEEPIRRWLALFPEIAQTDMFKSIEPSTPK